MNLLIHQDLREINNPPEGRFRLDKTHRPHGKVEIAEEDVDQPRTGRGETPPLPPLCVQRRPWQRFPQDQLPSIGERQSRHKFRCSCASELCGRYYNHAASSRSGSGYHRLVGELMSRGPLPATFSVDSGLKF